MTPYPNDGCPNCDPDHAPTTESAREWLTPDCWGRDHYHPYVEHDFHETAEMLTKVEREAAQQERERLLEMVDGYDSWIASEVRRRLADPEEVNR